MTDKFNSTIKIKLINYLKICDCVKSYKKEVFSYIFFTSRPEFYLLAGPLETDGKTNGTLRVAILLVVSVPCNFLLTT